MGLQVTEDPVWSGREQRIQRIGNVALVAVVVAALLGVAGHGPLSDATATSGGLAIEYQRVGRNGSEASLIVRPGSRGAAFELTISSSWVDGFELEGVMPEPDQMRWDAEGLVLRYDERPEQVELHLRYEVIGLLSGAVAADGHQLELATFVLP